MNRKNQGNRSVKSFLLLFAGLVLLAGAVAVGITYERNMTLYSVHFEGAMLTPVEVLQEVFPADPGVRIDSLDMELLAQPLRALPYVKEVRFRLDSRGRLHVDVHERQPVGVLADRTPAMLVDAEGEAMPMVYGLPVDLPLIYGVPLPETRESEGRGGSASLGGNSIPGDNGNDGESITPFSQVRDLLLAASRRSLMEKSLSEITWSEEQGVVAMSSERSLLLIFGRGDMDTKWRHWEEFAVQVLPREESASYRSVDFRFRDQIVARTTGGADL